MSHKEFKHIGDPIDKLVEELGELTVALMKVKRFGWFSKNPLALEPTLNNIDQVRLEMSDVVEAIEVVEQVMRHETHVYFAVNHPKINAHELFTDKDKDRPKVICDSNWQVVLGMCKKCGKAESELSEPCAGNKQEKSK